MSLKAKRRLASELLKVGQNRVWMDPERAEDLQSAITKNDVRKMIHEGAIRELPVQGTSRGRVRAQRKRGAGRGSGSRKGGSGARAGSVDPWLLRIRALRKTLKELRERRTITPKVYRRLYGMCKGGAFDSIAALKQYIQAEGLARRRIR